MYKRFLLILSCVAVLATSCKSSKESAEGQDGNTMAVTAVEHRVIGGSAVASPKVIIYRTSNDYNNLVPVNMDDTKTKVVSYPAPSDVRNKPVPTILDKGYLLDNRGIGKNVAFTSWTYDEYAAMETSPSQEEILAHIVDKNPLSEMWQCDNRHNYKNLVEDLNKLIADGFPGCKAIYRSVKFEKQQ